MRKVLDYDLLTARNERELMDKIVERMKVNGKIGNRFEWIPHGGAGHDHFVGWFQPMICYKK